MNLISGQGTRILCAVQHGQKNNKNKIKQALKYMRNTNKGKRID